MAYPARQRYAESSVKQNEIRCVNILLPERPQFRLIFVSVVPSWMEAASQSQQHDDGMAGITQRKQLNSVNSKFLLPAGRQRSSGIMPLQAPCF
ncbi:hypothetical protein Dda3937_04406 [Dickeya dadantii 3937]|uniref:Uncharacterized protein n=1 Tax=Dickeya dadantii (strain 3937) TaxID=198628 RepID=E0SH39_DICD3|nr:hypothetical protein Dda3937_04406 [Dickeya dadantii 3937]